MAGIVLAGLGLAMPVQARAEGTPPCDAGRVLERYLEATKRPAAKVAAFDHRERSWTIADWNGSSLRVKDGPTEEPEIALGKGDQLLTFIVNTNPLIFTADRTETKKEEIAALANVHVLVAALSSVAAASLAVEGADGVEADFHEAVLGALSEGDRNKHRPLVFRPEDQDLMRALQGRGIDTRSLVALREALEKYEQALEADLPAFDAELVSAAQRAGREVGATVTGLDQDRLRPWLQSVEAGVEVDERPHFEPDTTPARVAQAFSALEEKLEALAGLNLGCRTSTAALQAMIAKKRSKVKAEDLLVERDAHRAAGRSLARLRLEGDGCVPGVALATGRVVAWLLEHPPTEDGPAPAEAPLLEGLYDLVSAYLETIDRFSTAKAEAMKLAKTEPEVTAAAARVDLIQKRKGMAREVDLSCGVLEVPLSSFKGEVVPWSRKRVDTVTVKLDEGFKDGLTIHRPGTATGKLSVQRKFSDGLEADFSVTRTDLFDSTFVAKDLDGEDGGESQIQETERKSRSGKVAVMAAYRLPLFRTGLAVGPQVGVGVDTSDAALFYGLSVRWGFLSVGWGQTRQKVAGLRGQTVGQTLPAGESLRTRERFETDEYWSFSLTIRDLSFFKPKG
ncbi:MAG: hypothetical protein M5U13_03145 [Thermoanaerobaculia bacterium]|nr:hypothetical protein [Thermoanaerobaculia bacterium]